MKVPSLPCKRLKLQEHCLRILSGLTLWPEAGLVRAAIPRRTYMARINTPKMMGLCLGLHEVLIEGLPGSIQEL